MRENRKVAVGDRDEAEMVPRVAEEVRQIAISDEAVIVGPVVDDQAVNHPPTNEARIEGQSQGVFE